MSKATPPKRSLRTALKQTVASLMQAPETEVSLKNIEAAQTAALEAIAAKIAGLEAKRAAYLVDFAKVGWPDAKRQAEQLLTEIGATAAGRLAIENTLSEVRGKLAVMVAEQESQAAIGRLRDLARKRGGYGRSAENVEQKAKDLVGALTAHAQLGRDLSDLLAGMLPVEERRVFHAAAIDARARDGFFPLFALSPPGEDGSFNPDQWRWLKWPVGMIAGRRSFIELERDVLDRLVGFFPTRQEAEQTRDRLDPGGRSLHVVRDDDAMVFRLVAHQLAGDYSEPAIAVDGTDGEAPPK